MGSRVQAEPTGRRPWLSWRLAAEVGLLLLLLLGLQLAEPLSNLWVRDIVDRSVVDQRLSRLADEVVIQSLLTRRYEKDILLNLPDQAVRQSYMERWAGATAALELAIGQFAAVSVSSADQAQAAEWQSELALYRAEMAALMAAVDEGAIRDPEVANDRLDSGKVAIRDLINSAMAVAEQKDAVTISSSDALRQTLLLSARVIILLLVAGLLLYTVRSRR